MENKTTAELHTIKLFYEAVNDKDNAMTLGEHITQLLIDLYDCHLVQGDSGQIYSINQDKIKEDEEGNRYQTIMHNDIYFDELSDLFY